MIRWGILGAGGIARRFAVSLSHDVRAELVAVSCRTQEKADAACVELGAKRGYASHEALLADSGIDAIYLALPHGLHRMWAIAALRAGKAVLCEKPAALNTSEMTDISYVAREERLLFMEAMKTRFVPLHSNVLEHIHAGEIGEIRCVDASLCNDMLDLVKSGGTYHSDPEQGGALLDCGTYCASWIQELVPAQVEPKLVTIAATKEAGVNVYVDAKLSFGTVTARLECAFDRAKPHTVTIVGSKGRIVVEELHRPQRANFELFNGETYCVEKPYEVDDFYGEIVHFNDLLEAGATESPLMSLSSSCACMQILDAVAYGLSVTPHALETLIEQERVLRYPDSFGSTEALSLGKRIIDLGHSYERGVSVRIVRESDGLTLFSWSADDKSPRNDAFIEGKIAASHACGHASAWCWLEHELDGSWESFFDSVTSEIPTAGAFPIYDARHSMSRMATVCVSGLHEGLDHVLVVRALEEELGKRVPALPCIVA